MDLPSIYLSILFIQISIIPDGSNNNADTVSINITFQDERLTQGLTFTGF